MVAVHETQAAVTAHRASVARCAPRWRSRQSRASVAAAGVLLGHVCALIVAYHYRIATPAAARDRVLVMIQPPSPAAPERLPPAPARALPIRARLVFEAPPSPDPIEILPPPEATAPPAPAIAPVAAASPSTAAPALTLSGELSVYCPNRTPPSYPAPSRHLHEQGSVTLQVALDEQGAITGADIVKSSGYPRLDEAARAAVRTWQCNPPSRAGIATRAVATQVFEFALARR